MTQTLSHAPILPLEQLLAHVAQVRPSCGKVVLANGAFDLLHVGHLRYLAAAKAQGDVLVVAVNSDVSVRASKGPQRPIVPDRERAELVAALRPVDCVTIFDDPTVRPIIAALRPDIHAKGTDYTVASVPEAELVQALGGQVMIVGDPKDHATSATIERLQGLEASSHTGRLDTRRGGS